MAKYTERHPEKLREYAAAHPDFACTQRELAELFRTSRESICNWMQLHPEFRDAVLDVRSAVDDVVESALFKAAHGYEYTETTESPGRSIVTTKFVAPSVAACKMWLCNRRPDQWKDKSEQVITGSDGEPVKPVIIFGTPDDAPDNPDDVDTS